MHNPASVLENGTHKLLWDFNIQMDHLISARQLDLIIINKKIKKRTYKIVDFAVLVVHRVKLKENEKKDKYLDLARELKKLEHESDNYTNCDWCFWYSHQRVIKGTGELGNKRTSGDHPNLYIIEDSQNSEKSPGDLLSLKLQWKTIS